MRRVLLATVLGVSAALVAAETSPVVFVYPRIAGYGGVATVPEATEPPRADAKIVFDIVADTAPGEVNKGLESVARYLNLHTQAGLAPNQLRLACVLHGPSTKAALNDEAYARVTAQTGNPNLTLVTALKRAGVELFVCGQSLARNRYPASDVARDFQIAVSAMTVNVNKQADGFAYLSIH